MSLYLQIVVGTGRYLLKAEHVLDIVEQAEEPQGAAVPVIDLRTLFADTDGSCGCAIVVRQLAGTPAALLADRAGGMAEIHEAEFHPLPPIGAVGAVIDAVAPHPADRRPVLRLRAERALAALAAAG